MSKPKSDPATWPKLSVTLPHKAHPHLCQNCESSRDLMVAAECDGADQPTPTLIIVCRRCWETVVVPHPRLYHDLPVNAPIPGAMALCIDCVQRDGLRCRAAKVNGGPGITVTAAKPMVVHIDGRDPKTGKRFGRWLQDYSSPPSACTGRKTA
jgi:hypothetical protein